MAAWPSVACTETLHPAYADPIIPDRRRHAPAGKFSMDNDPHAALTGLLPRLVAFARTIVGNADGARDLVQEAAARALAARRTPEDAAAYRAWMFKIVRNAALDEIRRVRPQQIEGEPPVDLWRFDNACIAKITVDQGLETLPPAHREIIALIDIAGFSYSEAAGVLGVPIGTVMSRITRARGWRCWGPSKQAR